MAYASLMALAAAILPKSRALSTAGTTGQHHQQQGGGSRRQLAHDCCFVLFQNLLTCCCRVPCCCCCQSSLAIFCDSKHSKVVLRTHSWCTMRKSSICIHAKYACCKCNAFASAVITLTDWHEEVSGEYYGLLLVDLVHCRVITRAGSNHTI